MVLVGIDWSERWHDVCLMDDGGQVLGRRRIDDSPAGLTPLQSLMAEHAEGPGGGGDRHRDAPWADGAGLCRPPAMRSTPSTHWRRAAIGIATPSRRKVGSR